MAATAADNVTEDLTGTLWRDDEWLKYYPLTRFTALDYFALSTFYEPGSLNERARQQGLEPARIPSLAPGTEYALHDAQEPHLFVIRKQYRASATAVDSTPHAFYYILDGSIYQAPTLHAAVSSRMGRCLHAMRAALGKMQPDLDPLMSGNDKQGTQESEAAAEAAAKLPVPAPAAEGPSRKDRERVDAIIRNVLEEYGTTASMLPPLPPSSASRQTSGVS